MRWRLIALSGVLFAHGAAAATLSDLHWMVGSWRGSLGGMQVEESWSEAAGGTMSTVVRITADGTTRMIELIVIREQQNSMVLHLRQFSPALENRLAQDMTLHSLAPERVVFAGSDGAAIKALTYRRVSAKRMEVDVTPADGQVVTAVLMREEADDGSGTD